MLLSMLVIAFSGTTMVVKSLVMLLLGAFFSMVGQDPMARSAASPSASFH